MCCIGLALSLMASANYLNAQTSPATLLVQLQSDCFSTRQSAMYEIMKDPEPVIPFIELAYENADADFRKRTMHILANLASDPSTGRPALLAFESIERISFSKERIAARHAEDAKFQILLKRQYLAAKKLERFNAQVKFSEPQDQNGIPIATSVVVNEYWRGTREDLELVGDLIAVSRLELDHKQVDDEIIGLLPSTFGLTTLKLCRCNITEASIHHLSKVGTLSDLELLYCPVGVECFSSLGGLECLGSIRLIGTNVEPSEMSKLERSLATTKVDVRRGAFMGIRYSPSASKCKLTSLVPGSGAEKAGLQRGDTIIEFNGNSIAEYIDVTKLLRECKAGDHVEIKARRGGKTLGFDVVMGVWE
jgi:hypothetical protein